MSVTISLSDIERLALKAISDYKKIHGNDALCIQSELYWKISDDQVSRFDEEPSDFEVGNFRDEIEFLKRKLANGDTVGSESLSYISAIFQKLSSAHDSP